MGGSLGRLTIQRKNGSETFHRDGRPLEFDLLGFWQWSMSDLVSNATRGVLAEYIVARRLGLAVEGSRAEWAPYDLKTPSGIRVEVKSAAHVQSWHQKKLSTITFAVPETRWWDAESSKQADEAKRHADVYVFALLAHTEKATVDPLNLEQWRFYVLPTKALNERKRSQHSITLKSLENLCGRSWHYEELAAAVDLAAERCGEWKTPAR
jgi:hypothetical protein